MTAQQAAARPHAARTLWAFLVTALAGAGLVLWAVAAAPESFRNEAAYGAGGAGLALALAVTLAVRYRERFRAGRLQLAAEAGAAANASAASAADAARFADETVPAVLAQLGKGSSADTAVSGVRLPDNEAYVRALRAIAEEAARSENRRAAAMAACANAAGRMQAMATGMLADLRDMENRHADAAILGDLLHLDHRTAQAGRVADSIAVLSGARSGRRWAKPIAMESILRGAMGRIAGYQRVRLRSVADIAVAGHAAEGVMHVLAELLDNACNFSPPTTEVHVYVSEVPAGAAVTVEDAGLVMSETALRRAERAVAGPPGDLSTLTGTRLGLAVVGHLAYKHGLTVNFRPSAIGGTGVVVMIPQELISRVAAPVGASASASGSASAAAVRELPGGAAPGAVRELPGGDPEEQHAGGGAERYAGRDGEEHVRARPGAGDEGARHAAEETAVEPEPADFALPGLPQRRRGRALEAAHPEGLPGERRRERAEREPRAGGSGGNLQRAGSAARFGAFHRAVTGEETLADPPPTDRAPQPDANHRAAPAADPATAPDPADSLDPSNTPGPPGAHNRAPVPPSEDET
ncbi:sensor histidine kinase [Streptomyces boninensis]|uniref:ATP-binding protein n=1 Tax=Streptomyces boninensis TaxID=2039455 RepID=UPI003B218A66